MRRKYIALLLVFFLSIFILNYFFWLRPLLFKKSLISREVLVLKERLKAQQKVLMAYNSARKKRTILKQQLFFVPNDLEKPRKKLLNLQGSCPLSHYSLSKLKVVGNLVVDQIDKRWGLLKLPNGQICKVEVNDEIGIEKSKVILVGARKIIVQEKNSKKILDLGGSHLEEKYSKNYKQ